MKSEILQPERNCWRVVHAPRLAILVNGATYFRAFRDAVKRAQRSVGMLAWDVDSRQPLVESADDALPVQLSDFLNAVVTRNRKLDIHVLSWDFATLFALAREPLPVYKLDWRTHRRLRFRLDAEHPTGGCHHQKVVVVDRMLGFVGGLDLTAGRWDTAEHRREEPLRRRPGGEMLRPYHDIQAMVDGDAAEALADLFSERWQLATRERVSLREGEDDPWPEHIQPDLLDVQVGIARTMPGHRDREAVHEVEQLFFDSIAAAEHRIFIENQYLSNAAVVDALCKRLSEADGPEVLIIEPLKTDGWLSQNTMDVLRAEQLDRLKSSDEHGHLGVYYPDAAHLDEKSPINVHAKLMVIDDEFLRVGSANICNRSMRLDTECDIAVQVAPDSDNASAIRSLRQRLLANHLGTDQTEFAAAEQSAGSMLGAVEALRGGERTLVALEAKAFPDRAVDIPNPRIADPEQPLEPSVVLDHFVPPGGAPEVASMLWRWGALVAALLALAAVWRWTPLAELLAPEKLAALASGWRDEPLLPAMVVLVFVVGGSVMVPLTLLVTATVLALGPWQGFLFSLLGALCSAALTYWAGSSLGRENVRRLAGKRLNEVSRAIARRGVLAVAVIRLVPVAPFTVVNLVAGASHVSFRDFLAGSVLGMVPGMAGLVLLVDGTVRILSNPDAVNALYLAGAALLLIVVGYAMRRFSRRRNEASTDATS